MVHNHVTLLIYFRTWRNVDNFFCFYCKIFFHQNSYLVCTSTMQRQSVLLWTKKATTKTEMCLARQNIWNWKFGLLSIGKKYTLNRLRERTNELKRYFYFHVTLSSRFWTLFLILPLNCTLKSAKTLLIEKLFFSKFRVLKVLIYFFWKLLNWLLGIKIC